jgi:hypothetical protein
MQFDFIQNVLMQNLDNALIKTQMIKKLEAKGSIL